MLCPLLPPGAKYCSAFASKVSNAPNSPRHNLHTFFCESPFHRERLVPKSRHPRWWSCEKCQSLWKAKGLTIDENSESLKSPEKSWQKKRSKAITAQSHSPILLPTTYCRQLVCNEHIHWSCACFNRQVYDFMIFLARLPFAVFALEPFPLSLCPHFISPFPSLSWECFQHLVILSVSWYQMQHLNPRCFVATCTFPRVIEACLAHSLNSIL